MQQAYRERMDEKPGRGSPAGMFLAVCIVAGMLAAAVTVIAVWGWMNVAGVIVLAAGAWSWMFRTEYNNPGWRDRR